jgi:hypothetical protein
MRASERQLIASLASAWALPARASRATRGRTRLIDEYLGAARRRGLDAGQAVEFLATRGLECLRSPSSTRSPAAWPPAIAATEATEAA